MDKSEIVNEYITISKQIEQLEKRKKALHNSIIVFRAHGIEFDEGIKVIDVKSFNGEATKQKWIEKGLVVPMKLIPEQIIPAHEDLDVDLFKFESEREALAVFDISYRVTIKKEKRDE
jgi:aromatic ring-opening dioxygenase LigB subunit